MYDHIIVTTPTKVTYKETAVCFAGVNRMPPATISRMVYRVGIPASAEADARYIRRKLVPALGLDKSRVKIGQPRYIPGEREISITSYHGDRMDDVYILTSIFRSFREFKDNMRAVTYMIRKGVDPLVAYALGSKYALSRGKFYQFGIGMHYVICGDPIQNYKFLLEYTGGHFKNVTLTTTAPHPRPSPNITNHVEMKGTDYYVLDAIGENLQAGKIFEAEKLLKEAV